MKWYGIRQSLQNKFFIRQKQYSLRRRLFKKSFLSTPFLLYHKRLFFYLPPLWEFVMLKKKKTRFVYYYLYTGTYFFVFFTPVFVIRSVFDRSVSAFSFSFQTWTNFVHLFWVKFKTWFYSFSKLFFRKIKFKGKGYYIYKNTRNTIAPQFGYSHLRHSYNFFLSLKFLSKTSVLFFGINYTDTSVAAFSFFYVKPVNIFTGKGIRFSRQIIYKKIGKASSYR